MYQRGPTWGTTLKKRNSLQAPRIKLAPFHMKAQQGTESETNCCRAHSHHGHCHLASLHVCAQLLILITRCLAKASGTATRGREAGGTHDEVTAWAVRSPGQLPAQSWQPCSRSHGYHDRASSGWSPHVSCSHFVRCVCCFLSTCGSA